MLIPVSHWDEGTQQWDFPYLHFKENPGYNRFYTSADCTGTAYLLTIRGSLVFEETSLAYDGGQRVEGTSLYYPSGIPQLRAMHSRKRYGGSPASPPACEADGGTYLLGEEATFDLSVFQAPFHIEP